ncbi:DExH-box ATP-dependent RNA helicase [Chloropicon primus]|uniref:RNA helicase n=3 Tax=Chloropicon primus TaxID=1764295 RepID=A0A5B8MIA2_9CHLO|nr:DExH-box ATP-dependent RNA helicase [Chloropicon primus]UPQ99233.1 DExH-box ATP-dependent RNA helicase [Chloropicon primus]|eukprot:QDZ20021.1 DExH-box ATP-dependent RNA helicase [Chloropicon primus]
MGRTKNIAEKKKKAHIYSGGGGGGTKGPEKVDKRNEEKQCPYCDRIFKQSGRLTDHIKKKHADQAEEDLKNVDQKKQEGQGSKNAVTMDVGSRGGYYTQKTPKMFLHEWCQKQKRPIPKYHPKQQGEGDKWTCKVVMHDPKKKENTIVFFLDRELSADTKEEACQMAAVVGLHRVAGDRAMHRVLPKTFLSLWDQLHVKSVERKQSQERRQEREEKRKEKEKRINEWFAQLPEVHLSNENKELVESLVAAFAEVSPDAERKVKKLDSEHLELIGKFTKLGFKEKDATNAVKLNGLDHKQALEWLCINVDERSLPKQYAPLIAPVTIVSQSSSAKDKSTKKEVKELQRYGYPAHEIEAALASSSQDVERAFLSLFGKLAVSNPDSVDCTGARGAPQAPSQDWQDEKEVLQAIFMEDFVDSGGSWVQVSTSFYDEKQELERKCVVEFSHPLSGPYPEEIPLIRMSIEDMDPKFVLEMTKVSATFAESLKGMPMLHDIVMNLPDALTQSRENIKKATLGLTKKNLQQSGFGAGETTSPTASKGEKGRGSQKRHSSKRQSLHNEKIGKELKERHFEIRKAHKEKIQKRKSLPVASYSTEILGVLEEYGFCVVCGETGCGKSTQIPQFLLENEILGDRAGYCSIICTQPRRISAIGLAERVAFERGEKVGDVIGYSVRLDSKTSARTRVTYCTIGILLRRLISDPKLEGVTHVIVDEVHERSLDSDMLLLLLKSVTKRRKDLQVVFMSATANAELFASYFSRGHKRDEDVIVSVPGKMFPVKQYFLEDACDQLGWQPPEKASKKGKSNEGDIDYKLIEHLIAMILEGPRNQRHSAILVFLPGMGEIMRAKNQLKSSHKLEHHDLLIVPLHSTLTPSEQSQVYRHAPKGTTKVILSTNIAETSITVDDVTFIIDAGRVKELMYDTEKGIAMLKETHISRASAKQRMGRAGRVAPGVCWHLFSGARYEKMARFQSPEILRVPLEMLCLKVKACIKSSLKESLENMITPPEVAAVDGAIHKLKQVQAMDSKEDLTPLGLLLSEMPVDACVGKLLIYGVMMRCVDPVMTIAAAVSSKSPFICPQEEREEANIAHSKFSSKSYKSDHLMFVTVFNAWQVVRQEGGYKKARQFCAENYLSFSALEGIEALRIDYARVLLEFGFVNKEFFQEVSRGISRMTHGEQHKNHVVDCEAYNSRVIKSVVCAAYYPQILRVSHPKALYKETENGTIKRDNIPKRVKLFGKELGQVFLHPASSLFSVSTFETGWLVYSDIMKTSKIMVRAASMAPCYSVLIFGGSIDVQHQQGLLVMDDWAKFKAPAKIAILVREMRELVSKLLAMKVSNPRLDISTSELVDVLLKILTTDGA